MAARPTVSLLILTINGEEKLARILPELQGIADELIIGIDDRTTDRSEEVARQFTDAVHPVDHEGFRGDGSSTSRNAVEDMLVHCSGDWVLRIDHDETLSTHWKHRPFLDALVSDRHATHYWIPRRWLLPPGNRYISNRHWFPDYQLRLYRNIPSLARFNRSPHDPPTIAGESRRLTRAWIDHWDLVWHDRQYRQAKVGFYKEINSYTGAEFYLYEDHEFEEKPTSYEAPCGTSRTATHSHSYGASIQILDIPRFYSGEVANVLIEITNLSGRPLHPTSPLVYPGNVSLSYHWYKLDDPIVLVDWEGFRQPLPSRINPLQRREAYLAVKAPAEPGQYLLQPDLVDEGVCWFSQRNDRDAFPTISVDVVMPNSHRARNT